MCDTDVHRGGLTQFNDVALLRLKAEELANPRVFDAVKNHQYQDECCGVQLSGDMKVRAKPGIGFVHGRNDGSMGNEGGAYIDLTTGLELSLSDYLTERGREWDSNASR